MLRGFKGIQVRQHRVGVEKSRGRSSGVGGGRARESWGMGDDHEQKSMGT